jgi:hypothetical protein
MHGGGAPHGEGARALPRGDARGPCAGPGDLGLRLRLAHVEPGVLVRHQARSHGVRVSPQLLPLVADQPRDAGEPGPRPHARAGRKLPRPRLPAHAREGPRRALVPVAARDVHGLVSPAMARMPLRHADVRGARLRREPALHGLRGEASAGDHGAGHRHRAREVRVERGLPLPHGGGARGARDPRRSRPAAGRARAGPPAGRPDGPGASIAGNSEFHGVFRS